MTGGCPRLGACALSALGFLAVACGSVTPSSFLHLLRGPPLFGLSCPSSGGKWSWWYACPVSLDPPISMFPFCVPHHSSGPTSHCPVIAHLPVLRAPLLGWGSFINSWGQEASKFGSGVNQESPGHRVEGRVRTDPTSDPTLASMWKLCDAGQDTGPLCVLGSASVRWG